VVDGRGGNKNEDHSQQRTKKVRQLEINFWHEWAPIASVESGTTGPPLARPVATWGHSGAVPLNILCPEKFVSNI